MSVNVLMCLWVICVRDLCLCMSIGNYGNIDGIKCQFDFKPQTLKWNCDKFDDIIEDGDIWWVYYGCNKYQ